MKTKLAICKWGLTSFLLTSVPFLHSNPSNPTVVSGNVAFSNPQTGTLQVSSSSSRSIVDWETFSVGNNETTNFVLPNSSAAILNRVTTTGASNASEILGTLSSNGQVYLINPNGILIGQNAVVNTHTFLASTLDTDNQDFLNATDLTFTGDNNGDVYLTHQGTITAAGGDIILLGYQVVSTGDLTATNGTVARGSGVEIVVQPNSSENRIVIVPQSSSQGTARRRLDSKVQLVDLGVDDSSAVEALKAELAADGNLYSLAIKHEGSITATGLSGQNCFVKMSAENGETEVNGAVTALNNGSIGGTIAVLGDTVTLGNSCTLTASGNAGGGEVYVGGGWGGNDPDLINATTTTVAENAVITVRANTTGDGGTAVIWADHTATFNGTISAQGGTSSGNGGAVEVSGVNTTVFNGNVDVSAENGEAGTLTIDPQVLIFHTKKKHKLPRAIELITRSRR